MVHRSLSSLTLPVTSPRKDTGWTSKEGGGVFRVEEVSLSLIIVKTCFENDSRTLCQYRGSLSTSKNHTFRDTGSIGPYLLRLTGPDPKLGFRNDPFVYERRDTGPDDNRLFPTPTPKHPDPDSSVREREENLFVRQENSVYKRVWSKRQRWEEETP